MFYRIDILSNAIEQPCTVWFEGHTTINKHRKMGGHIFDAYLCRACILSKSR